MRTDFPKTVPTAILLAFVAMTSLAASTANATATATKNKAAPGKATVTTSAKRKAAKATATTMVGNVTITAATTRAAANGLRTFKAEVWADNWFVLYNGDSKVGEDSVPITTERSFNAETFTFQARYPLQLRAISKDYKANDTGLEYIGTGRQQIGDGGFIAQITDLTTRTIVATTDATWRGLVIHAAPLNPDCEKSSTPEKICTSLISEEPSGWKGTAFDDSSWQKATVYSEAAVGVKDGYLEVTWDASAKLIWSTDLKIDNTILWRKTVSSR